MADDPGNEATAKMAKIGRHGRTALVFSAKNEHLNNGAALKESMEERFFQKR